MNKRLGMLLIPLLLLPIASFGYAHMYDYVEKKYKLYVGTMFANVTYFHVDYVKLIDVNNNGTLMDDELNVTVFEDNCKWVVQIEVNPVSPDFVLNTTMHIENVGDLPWSVTWMTPPIKWDNDTIDPCWDTAPTKSLPMWPEDMWSWEIEYYKWNGTCYTATPTEHWYKPGDKLIVKQHINLIQPDNEAEMELYKSMMGHWFWIWEIFYFETEPPITDSCWTFGDDQDIVCP